MNTTRNNGYTEAESEHLRKLFEEWKEKHIGCPSKNNSLVGNEDFQSALWMLIVVHGYSKSEICEWLGVSKQRVYQWTSEMGINAPRRGQSRYRWWNGNRFTPRHDMSMKEAKRVMRRMRTKARRRKSNEDRIQRGVRLIRKLTRENGRVPILAELCHAAGYGRKNGAAPTAGKFGHRPGEMSYAEFFDYLWDRAGYERPDGRSRTKE